MAQWFLLTSVRDGRFRHHFRCPQHTSATGHNSAWRSIISSSPGHWANVAEPANVQDHAGHPVMVPLSMVASRHHGTGDYQPLRGEEGRGR